MLNTACLNVHSGGTYSYHRALKWRRTLSLNLSLSDRDSSEFSGRMGSRVIVFRRFE